MRGGSSGRQPADSLSDAVSASVRIPRAVLDRFLKQTRVLKGAKTEGQRMLC